MPVIALTLIFARRYRAENKEAVYDPEWHHSTQLEVVIWTAPLLIIIALGAITWLGTHTLDPIPAADADRRGAALPPGAKPLEVQVVALDWKWLFFYPEQGIATVNELAAPVNVPISFKITSATVLNSFFIPALAGHGLRDGGDADATARGHQRGRRLTTAFRAITAGRASRA